MERLSSNYLSHYKRDIEVVKKILDHGFRHNMWEEKLISDNFKQFNFIVCFCDILANQADYHKKCYGDIAIVLTKEWAIRNQITPVRYIHKSSIGQKLDYIKIKNINREVREEIGKDFKFIDYMYNFLGLSLAKDSNKLSKISFKESCMQNDELVKFLNDFENEYEKFTSILKDNDAFDIFIKYFFSLGYRINELHNELEKRDSLMRIYQDDFESPANKTVIKDKVLYDEREWRSVKYINSDSEQIEYIEAVNNGYLPKKHNLTFTDEDLVAIVVNNNAQVNTLVDYINNNDTMISALKSASKIITYDNYNEV